MNPDPGSISLTLLAYSAAAWLFAAFTATLHQSFLRAGDVGIGRLTEKFPAIRKHRFWIGRWDTLCATLMIFWVLMALAAVALWFQAWTPEGRPWTLPRMVWVSLPALIALMIALRIVPAVLAESYSDTITLTFLPVAIFMAVPLYPAAAPLARLEKALLSLCITGADEVDRPTPEDEIRSLIEQAPDDGLEEEERQLIRSVFEFGETVTREIMTPRVDIQGLLFTDSIRDCANKTKNGSFSRYPVFADSQDDVRGIIHVRELLRAVMDGNEEEPVSTLCNKITFVPESMPINDLFRLLRTEQSHLAVVVDEYGGTAGLVTMEDVIEELVGEIHDEYDTAETRVQRLSDHSVLLDARMPVHEINEILKVDIPETDDYDSVAGYIFHKLGRIPRPGETIEEDGFAITVQTAGAHRIFTVRVMKKDG